MESINTIMSKVAMPRSHVDMTLKSDNTSVVEVLSTKPIRIDKLSELAIGASLVLGKPVSAYDQVPVRFPNTSTIISLQRLVRAEGGVETKRVEAACFDAVLRGENERLTHRPGISEMNDILEKIRVRDDPISDEELEPVRSALALPRARVAFQQLESRYEARSCKLEEKVLLGQRIEELRQFIANTQPLRSSNS